MQRQTQLKLAIAETGLRNYDVADKANAFLERYQMEVIKAGLPPLKGIKTPSDKKESSE